MYEIKSVDLQKNLINSKIGGNDMNTITINSITYSKLEGFALFQRYGLPMHIKRMRGILSGVECDNDNNDDERFSYIMMKNK